MKPIQFINFLNNLHNINPALIEAVKSGFSTIFEDSTETQVEDIKNKLNVGKVISDMNVDKYYKPKLEEPKLDEEIPSLEDLGVEEDTSKIKEPLEESKEPEQIY
jgi:hypothetical protein